MRESDEERIRRLVAEQRQKAGEREREKWETPRQELREWLTRTEARDATDEAMLLEAREWIRFWKDASRQLERAQRDEWFIPERRAAFAEALEKVYGEHLFRRLIDLSQALEEELGLPEGGDPLEERTPEDYEILSRWAAHEPLEEHQQERHEFLRRFSAAYQFAIGEHPDFARADGRKDPRLVEYQTHRVTMEMKKWPPGRRRAAAASGGPAPEPRLIRSPRDAELVAVAWMRYWGFDDAEATPVGADEGIDVVAEGAVAQVKAHMVPIGRPDLQNLAGVAAVEGKRALFFSLNGYTPQAIAWGDRASMALFTFDLQGRPEPVNAVAEQHAVPSEDA